MFHIFDSLFWKLGVKLVITVFIWIYDIILKDAEGYTCLFTWAVGTVKERGWSQVRHSHGGRGSSIFTPTPHALPPQLHWNIPPAVVYNPTLTFILVDMSIGTVTAAGIAVVLHTILTTATVNVVQAIRTAESSRSIVKVITITGSAPTVCQYMDRQY